MKNEAKNEYFVSEQMFLIFIILKFMSFVMRQQFMLCSGFYGGSTKSIQNSMCQLEQKIVAIISKSPLLSLRFPF